jgi:dTDP-4-amino-4,6-dideoxygalactose transaminase
MPATGTSPDIPLFDVRFEPEDLEAVARALRSGPLTGGHRVAEMEVAFAAYLGCAYTVGLASCTAALHLAYRAAGVGPGDEVIVPSYTFVATASAVLYCGATPVFADIAGVEDPTLDPADVAARITRRTKAVCAVHFAGYPASVDRLAALCDEHGLALIEDAAHTPGAELHGRALGTWGTAGCFSFFSNKVLPAGEGGLLATDDERVAQSARSDGLDCRLDNPRAALLLSRLPRLAGDIARRRELTRVYRRRLRAIDGLVVPFAGEQVDTAACHAMPVMLEDPARRTAVRQALREVHGVQTSVLYPAIHEFSAYRERFPGVRLPRTEQAARSEISLPLFPHMTEREQDRVLAGLEEALRR